jgi:hypothetical protein
MCESARGLRLGVPVRHRRFTRWRFPHEGLQIEPKANVLLIWMMISHRLGFSNVFEALNGLLKPRFNLIALIRFAYPGNTILPKTGNSIEGNLILVPAIQKSLCRFFGVFSNCKICGVG